MTAQDGRTNEEGSEANSRSRAPHGGTIGVIRAINSARSLKSADKHLLLTMLGWADMNSLELRPSVETIAAAMESHPQTVRRRLAALERLGVVEFLRRSSGGRCSTHRLRINLSALTAPEPMLIDVSGPRTTSRRVSATDRSDGNPRAESGNPRAALGYSDAIDGGNPRAGSANPSRCAGGTILGATKQPQPQPAIRGEDAGAGRRGGGDVESRETESRPVPSSVPSAAGIDPRTTARADRGSEAVREAVNASTPNPVVEALVALSVPRAEARRLAELPHTTLGLVAFVAEAAARQKPNRPARFIASLVERGPEHLEGWDRHLAERSRRDEAIRRAVIQRAAQFAVDFASDAVYAGFLRAVSEAIRPHFGTWRTAIADGQIEPDLLRGDSNPAEVLASLARSCGVELEVPRSTLRISYRDGALPEREGASYG